MEALHGWSAPSLSWKECVSPLCHARKWDPNSAIHAKPAVLGRSLAAQCTRTVEERGASCCYGLGHRRRRNVRGVSAVAKSPYLLSDDEEETHVPAARVKRLQDAVGPNKTLLDAQARVCTGPTQTRPLDEAQAFKVLNTILQSGTRPTLVSSCMRPILMATSVTSAAAKGELHSSEKVSKAQMGAFFGAMTLRANCFPPPTQWSSGERKAMTELWPALSEYLPVDVLFLADPEGTIMGAGPLELQGISAADALLVRAVREVTLGRHLGREELAVLLQQVLPLQGPKGDASDALLAAFMICSRMIKETDAELDAYCTTFDEELGSAPIAKVKSLTHYGEPYDGNTRFFRSSLFVAAVRASYGETCLLHGVEWMPPKGGVTEELMLKHLGANTTLTPKEAVRLLEDKGVGFAYISQREARPSLYSLVDLREHIKKRPPIATTEKVQRYIKGIGREAMVASFYHEGYEDSLLKLIRRRGVQAGLVVKGEEGALSLTTKDRSPVAVVKGRPLNYVAGFRPQQGPNSANTAGDFSETFTLELDAKDYGFAPSPTPRTDRSVEKNVELGMAALRGEKGPAYDRIVLNAAVADHLLGCEGAESPLIAVERAKEAIDSGRALNAMLNYIDRSKWPAGTPLPSTE